MLTTGQGAVRGVERHDVRQFRGLRYGETPTGPLRFRPPVAAAQWSDGWEGTLDATTFANRAMQPPMAPVFGGAGPGRPDEDCLFLNVFTPTTDGADRPVLCWIHGGAYRDGSANDYNGSVLAAQGDVVVVAINYRLGAFGFLDLAPLDPSYAGSAANGIRDQILALEWIRDHIADFGGDPENVTIFGESAGGGSVMGILAAPDADGLYRRAIAHSPGGVNVATRGEWAERLASALEGDGSPIERLLAASAQRLLDVQVASQFTGGTIDGTVITRHPVDAIRERGAAGVPLVVGTNRDEGTLFTIGLRNDPATLDAMTRNAAIEVTRAGDVDQYLADLADRFPGDDEHRRAVRVWTDLFRRTSVDAAGAATAAGVGGWLYRFDLPTTIANGQLGATHAAEIAFTFNWFGADRPMGFAMYDRDDPALIDLATRWSGTIVAFARSGDPNCGALPHWSRYDADDRVCLMLDDRTRIERDPDGADRNRWR